ncbi:MULTISPECIES: hypothetical protein [unclassified Streptomyces]|uniref:hypothetical protein n=1 Tax=unclassified Streptomyces TaxID=2593676 RepID=UPI003396A985
MADRTARLINAWTPAPRTPQTWQRPGVVANAEQAGAHVHFPPIANGLDYLRSASDHLRPASRDAEPAEPVPVRNLKYAILHLAAGAEVLLKARLQLEHWTLIFKDPGRAKRTELENGTFVSCSPGETLDRLRDIADVRIDGKDATALTQLANHRNALQHYGLTGPSAEAPAVESRTGAVLDFLIRFLDEELLPALTQDERDAVQGEMEGIREGLVWIDRYTTKRMQRLSADLAPFRTCTISCSDCAQVALVVGDGNGARCYFCWSDRSIQDAMLRYMIVTQGRGPGRFDLCSACGARTVLNEVTTVAAPDSWHPVALCFTCGGNSPSKPVCWGCNNPFEPTHRESLCKQCTEMAELSQ